MLFTLAASALRSRLSTGKKPRSGEDSLAVTDLPRFAREELGLYGLNLNTGLLAGADVARLDAIRDAADKASCPCLVLVESEAQPLATEEDRAGDAAITRCQKVVQAASRLGCSSIAVRLSGSDSEEGFDFAVERMRRVLSVAERLEVNVLVSPSEGLTSDPERLTDLIKKVGGFRMGTMPDFQTASQAPDPVAYLKRVTPYAQAVTAAAVRFKPGKKGAAPAHEPYDLGQYARAVQAVGYTGTLAIDYRGEGDAVEAILAARDVLESSVGTSAQAAEPSSDDNGDE